MRRAQDSDDAALVLVFVALVLMIAVIVAIAQRQTIAAGDNRFISVDPGDRFGYVSPLAPPGHEIRVNELPQIR